MHQEYDAVVPPSDLDAFAVSEDGQVKLDLAQTWFPMEDHDFGLPEGKAQWVGMSEHGEETLQWDVVPTWEDLVATGRQIVAMQARWSDLEKLREQELREIAERFFADPKARATTIERDYVEIEGNRFRNLEAVNVEARKRLAADHEETKKANREQLADWIARHGTDNQRQRLIAGLLPWQEAFDCADEAFFEPLASFALHERIEPGKVCICFDQCEVKFQSIDSAELTAEEWELFARIKAAAPDAEFRVREHRAECVTRDEPLVRRSVVVKFKLGALSFKRQLSLSKGEE